MTTWVGGVCAKKRANEARFNRWRSMMRHCALAIASWNTLFARSTAIVVAFILVSSWLLLMGSADAAHSAASEPGGGHTIVVKLRTACENTENSPRVSETTEIWASFRCSVSLAGKLDSVSSPVPQTVLVAGGWGVAAQPPPRSSRHHGRMPDRLVASRRSSQATGRTRRLARG